MKRQNTGKSELKGANTAAPCGPVEATQQNTKAETSGRSRRQDWSVVESETSVGHSEIETSKADRAEVEVSATERVGSETSAGYVKPETSVDLKAETSVGLNNKTETSKLKGDENQKMKPIGNDAPDLKAVDGGRQLKAVSDNQQLKAVSDEQQLKAIEKNQELKAERQKPYFLQPVDMKPGENARYLRMARVAMNLPPIDISDPKQVEQRINEYFDFCEANDTKPHVVGMASWIGISRETLNKWKTGDWRSATHLDVIKKAFDCLEGMWLDYMQNGKVNPAAGIFIGKNWFGYRDEQNITVKPDQNIPSGDPDAARRKYLGESQAAENDL